MLCGVCGTRQMKRPSPDFNTAKNAARLTVLAEASYWTGHEHSCRRDALKKTIQGRIEWWNHGNASGVILRVENKVYLGFAGTNDHSDVVNDLDITPASLTDLHEIYGIPTIKGLEGCYSTSGFIAHAAMAYLGVVNRIGVQLAEEVWLCGHSLGGAVAQIIQLTSEFENSRCVTFGAPKVFRGRIPEQLRTSIRRITDPVIYAPPMYKHPAADVLYVRYSGSLRRELPAWAVPITYWYTGLSWARRILQYVLSKAGVPISPLPSGHSMVRYRTDLIPLL